MPGRQAQSRGGAAREPSRRGLCGDYSLQWWGAQRQGPRHMISQQPQGSFILFFQIRTLSGLRRANNTLEVTPPYGPYGWTHRVAGGSELGGQPSSSADPSPPLLRLQRGNLYLQPPPTEWVQPEQENGQQVLESHSVGLAGVWSATESCTSVCPQGWSWDRASEAKPPQGSRRVRDSEQVEKASSGRPKVFILKNQASF